MTIKLDIASNLTKVDLLLKDNVEKVLPKVMKRVLRRTTTALQRETIREIRLVRALKMKDIRRKWLKVVKNLSGRDIATLETFLLVNDRPIPLIEVVRGSKQPRPQKGISVRKRRKVRIRIKPGKSTVVRGGFIAKGPRGNTHQVFRRSTTSKGPIKQQSAPSLHLLFVKGGMRKRIEGKIGKRMEREFINSMAFILADVK